MKKAQGLALCQNLRSVFLRGHGSGYLQNHHQPIELFDMPGRIMTGTY
jgi:hypothetical protein